MTPSPTLLLVEDDEVDALAVRRAFKNLEPDVQIVRASDGEEGLATLRSLRADGHVTVVVLLDLNMPRMSGAEFLSAMRSDSLLSSTVTFVLTTSRDERDVRMAYEHNIAGYLTKNPSNASMEEVTTLMGDYFRGVTFPISEPSRPEVIEPTPPPAIRRNLPR